MRYFWENTRLFAPVVGFPHWVSTPLHTHQSIDTACFIPCMHTAMHTAIQHRHAYRHAHRIDTPRPIQSKSCSKEPHPTTLF